MYIAQHSRPHTWCHWFVFQPNFAFRKRTTIGLSRVQKTRKTQRPDSFFPPEFDDDNNLYDDANTGAVNHGIVDVDDNELYVNAKHA